MAKGEELPTMLAAKKKRSEDDDSLPLDVGQKPIQLQRRRVWRACESCRRKKVKCDGCEPTCSQCASSGSQCTWLQTKDRAALSRHYVQELEARLLHMESLFTQIAPVLEQLGPLANGAVPSSSTAPSTSGTTDKPARAAAIALRSLAPKVQQSPEPSTPTAIQPEDEVSESFGQLALDEYGHMRWIGGSSTMSLIQSFKSLTSSPLHRISPMEEDPHAPGPSVNKLYFPAAVFFGQVRALPGPEEVEYPERDLADKLVEAYFAKFHFLMPVIDKPSFIQKYRQLMDNTHDHVLARSETAFLSLVFAVFACAANLVQDPRLTVSDRHDDGGMGMVYYERALILQYISHPIIQIAHVQCFILMSSFLCSVNCLPQAWILLGQAVRTGQDLGLHRSPRVLLISSLEKETRRKVWWGVYTLDRMLALALGRPLGINDSDCDVEMPVDIDDENLPEYFSGAPITQRQPSLMAGMINLIKLYEIAGRILRQVYTLENCKENIEPERRVELQKTVESFDNELTKWCDDLQPAFKSQSETEEQVSMGAVLCSHYYCLVTTLHRNFIPVRHDQLVTPKSTAKAVSSARSCIRLAPSMKHVVPPSHHLAFFIQNLFSSAVILLLYAMHSNDSRAANQAKEEAKSALPALEAWEGNWPGARKCKELLIDLLNTANDAVAKAQSQARGANVEKVNGTTSAQPTSPISPRTERRKSVTIATAPSSSLPPGRAMRTRTRRTQSRDHGTAGRRLSAVSPYRVDNAVRARSTSRRRGPDDGESGNSSISYYQPFSPATTPSGLAASTSQHSSPASGGLPSPTMTTLEQSSESSPSVSNNFATFNNPISPVAPSSLDYDYAMQPSPLSQSQTSAQPWNSNGNSHDRQAMDIYTTPTIPEPTLFSNSFGYGSTMDGNFSAFDATSDVTLAGLSTAPPSTSFSVTGLPFRGLDYIRNYSTGGISASGEQDSLWSSYDPGAFGLDPDLPFTTLSDVHETTR